MRQVDGSHATTSNLFFDFVTANLFYFTHSLLCTTVLIVMLPGTVKSLSGAPVSLRQINAIAAIGNNAMVWIGNQDAHLGGIPRTISWAVAGKRPWSTINYPGAGTR